MFNISAYNLEVMPGTRNHKGFFVQEVPYKLMEIDRAGWALICRDEMTCHYVDPESLRLVPTEADS